MLTDSSQVLLGFDAVLCCGRKPMVDVSNVGSLPRCMVSQPRRTESSQLQKLQISHVKQTAVFYSVPL